MNIGITHPPSVLSVAFFTQPLPDAEATTALAHKLSTALKGGDVLLLSGDLGAGKTHFARSLIQHLLAADGLSEDVPSPTFTLVQTYHTAAVDIWHADLYRLTDGQELWELGLEEAFETAICLVEWPERLEQDLPDGAVWLRFDTRIDDPDFRQLSMYSSANSELAKRLAEPLEGSE